jgi:hypothetical protein
MNAVNLMSRTVYKTSRIIVFSLLAIILIAVVSYKFLDNVLFGKHELEQFGLTYEQYMQKTNKKRIKIPDSSEVKGEWRPVNRD